MRESTRPPVAMGPSPARPPTNRFHLPVTAAVLVAPPKPPSVHSGTNDAFTDWKACEAKFVADYSKLIRLFQQLPHPPRIRLVVPPNRRPDRSGCKDLCKDKAAGQYSCVAKCKLPDTIAKMAKAMHLPKPISLHQEVGVAVGETVILLASPLHTY